MCQEMLMVRVELEDEGLLELNRRGRCRGRERRKRTLEMIVNLSSVEQVKAVKVSQDVCCLLKKAVELRQSNGCAVDQTDMFWAVAHRF